MSMRGDTMDAPPAPVHDEDAPHGRQMVRSELDELLQEQRIPLQDSQVLTAFLVILPFQQGFTKIDQGEKSIYLITFICTLVSLILFAAPAAQHRLERPLRDRARFKREATHTLIAGLAPLSVALILVAKLIVGEVVDQRTGTAVAVGVALILGALWWALPLARKVNG